VHTVIVGEPLPQSAKARVLDESEQVVHLVVFLADLWARPTSRPKNALSAALSCDWTSRAMATTS
jgi:hypothetical protein